MDDPMDRLLGDLQRHYDLLLDRRKTLSSQATSLITFTGIIDTILITLIVTVATDQSVHQLLAGKPQYNLILSLAITGFASYVATTISSLIAYWDPKWRPAPALPSNTLKSIDYFIDNKEKYAYEKIMYQYGGAIDDLQKTNNRKYDSLRVAIVCLIVGISLTTVAAMVLISSA